ncbi:Hsp70 family protein [Candidatus Sumerlaeota bacterium]|nr:Hsp70 family protein [Candidatus Sumerlaeota bacterium]
MTQDDFVVGIDLGTTYSALAYIDSAGNPQIVPNLDNERVTPSVVSVQHDRVIVGRIAKEIALSSPETTVQFVKTHMGRRRKRLNLGGFDWSPEEISAMILRKVVQDAEAGLGGQKIVNAVITVPAFFTEQQRKSTEDAGRIAGLNVMSIINEPTAAALAYGFHELGSDQTILVYDLGGGTFDVTIMRIEGHIVRMLATDGDVQLGGKDWDQRLIDFIAEDFAANYSIDPRDYPDSFQELLINAEQAKVRLSKLNETRVLVNCGGYRHPVSITRDQFEELTADLLAQTETTLRLVVEEAGLDFRDIDECLMVGGSTRMPGVHTMFERIVGKKPRHILNPDECVAQGAAIHAVMTQLDKIEQGESFPMPDIPSDSLERFRMMEERLINAHTLGIKALHPDGRTVVAPVIPRLSSVPCREVRQFQTSRNGQQVVRIAVMEGESTNPEACTEIGTCFVQDLPLDLAQGTPIEVLFEYTRDSRLNVSATLPTIQQSAHTDIQRTAGLTPDEIEEAKQRLAQLRIE